MFDVQVAIVGGGPAGATCAEALAARGIEVCILEARPFPRTKVCGQYISPAAKQLLELHLEDSTLWGAGARRVDRLELFADGQKVAHWSMPDWAWSLSRARLDALLLDRARSRGAIVCQPAVVRSVTYADRGVEVSLDRSTLRAACVVHADGVGRHDPAGPVPTRRGVVASKCHLKLRKSLGSVLQLHGFRLSRGHGYFGIVGAEDGWATLAMVAEKTLIKHFGGVHDHLLEKIFPPVRMAQATRVSAWQCSPVPCSDYVRPGHGRSFRIGNAAGAVEPVGGEGIGLAIWAGRYFGCHYDPADLARTQDEIRQAYRRRLRVRRPACLAAATLLRRPMLMRALCSLLGWQTGFALRLLYHFTGKGGDGTIGP